MLHRVFETLSDWRHLPAYQLERRADIFFAVHLDKILRDTLNVDVKEIIPEFPIRIGTILPHIPINKSYKVDYAVFDSTKCYLVELKTDNASTRDEQFAYYYKSIKVGFPAIVEGLLDIVEATNGRYQHKYEYLIDKLVRNGSISDGKPTTRYSFFEKPIFIVPTSRGDDPGTIVLDYDKIGLALSGSKDALTNEFSKALLSWKNPA